MKNNPSFPKQFSEASFSKTVQKLKLKIARMKNQALNKEIAPEGAKARLVASKLGGSVVQGDVREVGYLETRARCWKVVCVACKSFNRHYCFLLIMCSLTAFVIVKKCCGKAWILFGILYAVYEYKLRQIDADGLTQSTLLASRKVYCAGKINVGNLSGSTLCSKLTLIYLVVWTCLNSTTAEDRVDDLMHRRLTITTQTYTTVGTTTFVVPAGVTRITATLHGGGGKTVTYQTRPPALGGLGAIISATIPVTPGEVLQINVGGQGGKGTGGFNGGGVGCAHPSYDSSGGGGASDIRRTPHSLNDRLIVAGAGGGGYSFWSARGGNGGYPAGENGQRGTATQFDTPTGGTQSAGGTTSNPSTPHCYNPGTFGVGGSCCNQYGGAGGGGWWGGGQNHELSGGGGSSYVAVGSGVQLISHSVVSTEGPGRITLEFAGDPTVRPTTAPTVSPSTHPSTQSTVSPTTSPTVQPSPQPTGQPSGQPSRQPSRQPSSQPSRQPSSQPSFQPSSQPSNQPSCQPSRQPSNKPSRQPSSHPSCQPTSKPSYKPSGQPSSPPSAQPSSQPSCKPTRKPTCQPTRQPSSQPSIQPSSYPSCVPTAQPTLQPVCSPTGQPTAHPSFQPSKQPTSHPSGQPLAQPSTQPSMQPSSQPFAQPSRYPTGQPSCQPTSVPSNRPTTQPSCQPTNQPTVQPTAVPSSFPTSQPSEQPLGYPTMQPITQPSVQPSSQPTCQPSTQPSTAPTNQPVSVPSGQPSVIPSGSPTIQPSSLPSSQPSAQPSIQPSAQPSYSPSGQPSTQPSILPSNQPSRQPSSCPTAQPSAQPSEQPTSYPSARPSTQPSAQPSCQPLATPSTQPSPQPSRQPSTVPSVSPTLLITAREYAYIQQKGSSFLMWETTAHIDNVHWGCGREQGSSKCAIVNAPGNLQTLFQFGWSGIHSLLQTSDIEYVFIGGYMESPYTITSEIAKCSVYSLQLQCSVKSFSDTRHTAGSVATSVSMLVYVGTSNVYASVTIIDTTTLIASNYRYSANIMQSISMSHVHSPPNFAGSFVAGTCTSISSVTLAYLFAGMVRTDSGTMTAMYVTPSRGTMVNSADLVTAMALEYSQPDSFIVGGLQMEGETSEHAYLVRVNALYQRVSYGVRYRAGGIIDGRSLQETTLVQSAVEDIAITESVLCMLVSWTTFSEGISLTRMSVLKADMNTGAILQQVHIMSNTSSIYCSHMSSAGLFLRIACTVQYSINDTRSLLLSVDRQLTISQLPDGFARYAHNVFSVENVAFHRTKMPLSVDKTASTTTDYTFSTTGGSPTVQPTIITTSNPSVKPSRVPSSLPSSSPSAAPSVSPQPTSHPSSSGPTNTYKPTVKLTPQPTVVPTDKPTVLPSSVPTIAPTAQPTAQPSRHPIAEPSTIPTVKPTRAPQCKPTLKPSAAPSIQVTQKPSLVNVTVSSSSAAKTKRTSASALLILLYVLGGLMGLWCMHRVFQCYLNAAETHTRKKKMGAHRHAMMLNLAPHLSHEMSTYTPKNDSPAGENIDSSREPSRRGDSARGAFANSSITIGAYASGPVVNTAVRVVDTSRNEKEAVSCSSNSSSSSSSSSSSCSASVVLSSLHSSEMSYDDDIEDEEGEIEDRNSDYSDDFRCVHSDEEDPHSPSSSQTNTTLSLPPTPSQLLHTRSRESAMKEGSAATSSDHSNEVV